MSKQFVLVAKRADHVPGSVRHSTANSSKEVTVSQYCVHRKDSERTGGHDLQAAGEDTGFVQLRGD